MQPIERYALVTLLFLVVLVLVVAYWDDGSATTADASETHVARVDESRRPAGGPVERVRTPDTARPPISGHDDVVPRDRRVTSHFESPSGHSAEPRADRREELRPVELPPESLDELMRPDGRAAPDTAAADTADPFRPPGSSNGLIAESGARGSEHDDRSRPVDRPRGERDARSGGTNVPAPEPPAPAARPYVVRSGDTLERIARNELGDARAIGAIARLNGLSKPYTIYAGRTLKLPARSEIAATVDAGPRTASAAPGEGRTAYTFRSGDILSLVLERELGTYKRSIALVKELNPDLDPDRIAVGMQIVLPRADEIPGTPANATAPAPSASAGRVAASAPTARRAPADSEYVVR